MRRLFLLIAMFGLSSCDLLMQSKSEPVSFAAPVSQPSNFETSDSSYLKLRRNGTKLEVQLLNKITVIEDLNRLDSFLMENSQNIDKEKVVVTSSDSMVTRKLGVVLAKYGVLKFRVNVEER